MSKEKPNEAAEIFIIISDTINGANFDDLCDAAHRIVHIAGYRKQSEGEWTRVEINGVNYGQVYYQHKECKVNETQLFPSPYHFCPNCGAKMKGGAE